MARGGTREDKEIQEFRDIMSPPDRAEHGFSGKTIMGAIFLGVFMLPGSMYLKLFMGAGIGPAARWVTVILFAEVARRSLKSLRQQEVFILFYMTGIALATPFQGLLWNQYLVQSPEAHGMGIAAGIPSWVAPSAQIIKQTGNTLMNRYWLMPILLFAFQLILTRVNGFGLGYALYRLTAHGEKLPFPMAPVSAQGVLALTEDKETQTPWRWTAFATGGVLGLGFGFLYVGIPSLTGSLTGTPYQLLPIPWLDLTTKTQTLLPATPVNLVFDLTLVIMGMVLPFWAVVGGFAGLVITMIANPLMYKAGWLVNWREGMGVVDTMYNNHIDFYLSFTIGLTLAIFVISMFGIFRPLLRKFVKTRRDATGAVVREPSGFREMFTVNRLRGDISIWAAVLTYVLSTLAAVIVCMLLIPKFPWYFFAGFGFVYIPIISYATAKLEGLVGQAVTIPLVREAVYILSGYQGVDIWFAPMPIVNYGIRTREFRVMELTGTRVSSLIKTELVCLPIVIVGMVLFSQFIWRLGPIPSEAYPFTQEVWRLQALKSCVTMTSTMEGGSKFMEALSFPRVGWGLGLGVAGFSIMSWLGLPTFLVYGLIRGVGQITPGHILPEFVGAIIGRYYFRRKFGPKRWRRMIPVVLAGFSCGIGLMAMASVGIALIAKSISSLLY